MHETELSMLPENLTVEAAISTWRRNRGSGVASAGPDKRVAVQEPVLTVSQLPSAVLYEPGEFHGVVSRVRIRRRQASR